MPCDQQTDKEKKKVKSKSLVIRLRKEKKRKEDEKNPSKSGPTNAPTNQGSINSSSTVPFKSGTGWHQYGKRVRSLACGLKREEKKNRSFCSCTKSTRLVRGIGIRPTVLETTRLVRKIDPCPLCVDLPIITARAGACTKVVG